MEKGGVNRMKKFTIPELVVIALTAALNFVIFIVLEPLFAALHMPPLPILFIVAMNYVLLRFIVDKYWTITLSLVIFSILATFTPIWGGVPGLHKIPIAFIAGIATDTALSLTKKFSYVFRGILYGAVNGLIMMPLMTFTVFFLFHSPLSQKMVHGLIVVLTIVDMVVEAFGGILAAVVFKKIKDNRAVKMIQAWRT
jgi:hypothetical protein